MKERVSRRRALAALGVAGTTILAGCNGSDSSDDEPDDETSDSDDASSTESDDSLPFVEDPTTESFERPYLFGLSPNEPQHYKMEQYEPVQSYLDDELGETELRYTANYEAAVRALENADLAFAETGSFVGALAARDGLAEFALQRRAFGSWNYTSVIITEEDSGIETLSDLENKTIAFADTRSASGSVVPLWMLQEDGVEVGEAPASDDGADFTATWSGHGQAFQTLRDGQADAAAVGKFITQDSDGYVSGIEPIADYEKDYDENGIPRAPIMTSAALSPDVRKTFVDAMVDAPDRVYLGENGKSNSETDSGENDDLWFSGMRSTDRETYQSLIDIANDLDLTLELLSEA